MIRLFGLALVFISLAFVSIGQDQKKSRLASILSITGNDSTSFSFEQGVTHLTFVFQDMLTMAESMFGKRDPSWTYIGLEFGNFDVPHVRYYPDNRISIALTKNCSKLIPYHPQMYFQMAHEVCHVLYPSGTPYANILEEGVSAYFSKVYVDAVFPGNNYAKENIVASKYFRAFSLVDRLMRHDPNSILKIRNVEQKLSLVTKDQLLSLNFEITEAQAEELAHDFYD